MEIKIETSCLYLIPNPFMTLYFTMDIIENGELCLLYFIMYAGSHWLDLEENPFPAASVSTKDP